MIVDISISSFIPTDLIFTVSSKRCSITISNLDSVPVEKVCKYLRPIQNISLLVTYFMKKHVWDNSQVFSQINTRVFTSFVAQYPCEWYLLLHICWWTATSFFAIDTISDCITPSSSLLIREVQQISLTAKKVWVSERQMEDIEHQAVYNNSGPIIPHK